MRGRILLVDVRADRRAGLVRALEEAGYAVEEAERVEEGRVGSGGAKPDLVITDLATSRGGERAWLDRIRAGSEVPVITVGDGLGDDRAASPVEATADDCLCAEGPPTSDLLRRVGSAIARARASAPDDGLEQRLAGASAAMVRVRTRVRGLAPLAQPVLVVGEEGTGRSAVVRALHELGATASGALARVDCATWEPTRGAPRTAAVHLDGVERLSPEAQAFWADLLTARLGPARHPTPRVLASAGPLFGTSPSIPAERSGEAAHRLCPRLVESLSRFPIELPPLRDRPEDVGPIAEVVVARLSRTMSRPVLLAPEAISLLAARRWRGNVRQLERLLERAVAFTTSGEIGADAIVELLDEVENGLGSIRRHRAHEEREALVATLRRTGGNVSRAATLLGRSRGAVYRLMAKHGLTAGRSA